MSQVVNVQDLSFRYRGQHEPALRNVSLGVQAGEFIVIMGSSGAGKSTLCQSFNGLIPHFLSGQMEGNVEIAGQNTRESKIAGLIESVGLVFQDFEAQLFSTNVRLEVGFGPENLAVERDEIVRRSQDALSRVGLDGFEARQPAMLSGGQKQRLAIASVLTIQPRLLCLDEPTTDLDPLGKTSIFEIADDLRKLRNVTLVMVEHEAAEALLADRLVIMDKGQIIRDGPATEVLRDVELFRRARVMPLQIPAFFSEIGYPPKERPLTLEESVKRFDRGDLTINPQRYESCVTEDSARATSYGPPIIEVESLSHRYENGGLVAVDGVDLEVCEGEFLAILGHNGSGKTTLVKHFNGLLKPSAGSVSVGGSDVNNATILELGNMVGYVFQNPDHQIFSDSVFDEVAFGLRARNISEEEMRTRVSEALRAVDLADYEEEDPFSLTKGERQRVAVASVLALRPQVLILDEPTTGLDYEEQLGMMELIRQLNASGSTIIMVTHTMWVVCEYAHRVVVMNNGKIAASGTVREVFSREEELSKLALKPPPIVSLSNAIGYTTLSVDELVHVTDKVVNNERLSVSG